LLGGDGPATRVLDLELAGEGDERTVASRDFLRAFFKAFGDLDFMKPNKGMRWLAGSSMTKLRGAAAFF